ncbi:NAD(P)-binding protein [Cucurbitaria berberidis CBS 394.84]|uniref:NAD(P)-binding protein n=1 Tax=Cucurbitaria berberidis CBS 394.84 TaxID=1168544 RepID=A0A9P4L5Q2_9PLEO|nr:NAD(P)-binding protein [Cucurbitaria berberidis CBS 394.84]KAF1843186.1 NAD(P)-binding protein [Cucurbitaria berberidis CBS 394.84]
MGGQLGFLLTQITFKPKPLPPNVRLDKQTAIITGSNAGIGLETARQLASHGVSRIILGVRDASRGATAKDDLAKTNPGCDFQVWHLDLESTDSIVSFADKVKTLDRLDIAVLNAAVKQLKFTTTASGHETNLQVNHIGTALLSLLIIPVLKSTSQQTGRPSRLTFTSSEVHFWTPFNERTASNILERMDQKDSFVEGMERYYTSKLLNVLWFRELASKVDVKEVIINGTNPGFIASQLHRHDPSSGFKVLKKLLAWTPEQGAYFVTDAAVSKQTESHGAYIQEQKITEPSKYVLSAEGKEAQKKLWDETIALFKKESPNANFDSILS